MLGIGWPWSRLCSLRNVSSSWSSTTPTALSIAYSRGDAWPLEKIRWSLFGLSGRSTSKRRCPPPISTAIRSAADIEEVGWPEFAAADARTESTRSCCPSSASWAESMLMAGPLRRDELVALAGHLAEQLLERVGELVHALALERVGHVLHVDARVGERGHRGLGLIDALAHGLAAHLAVILEGLDGLLGHGVD